MDTVLDRTLPHSIDAEKAVLGALLIDNTKLAEVGDLLTPETFYRDAHRRIYRVLLELAEDGAPLDFLTIREALTRAGDLDAIGGPAYLAALIDGVPHAMNVTHYAKMVKDDATRRKVIAASHTASTTAYDRDEDAATVVDRAMAEFLAVAQHAQASQFEKVSSLLPATVAEIEALAAVNSTTWGEPTGLRALDHMIRGLRPGQLVIIGARPNAGKTALAMKIAVSVAKRQKTVGVFSLEMSKQELMVRLACSEAQINLEDLRDQRLSPDAWRRLSDTYADLGSMALYIDDTPELSPVALRAKARRLQVEHGLALLVVDYVQLMQVSRDRKARPDRRHEEVAEISRALKLLSKDLQVPILVCAQLNRSPEARTDGRPQLGDLRESGALEQDADVAILIYRPEMYPKKATGMNRKRSTKQIVDEEVQKGVAELIIAKQRNGPTGGIKVLFRPEFTRFENLVV